jgi:nucleoside-diphosphate-sugar epimerase
VVFLAVYIITGGAGFIGSHVVEELVKRGERVKVIDNLLTGRIENIEPFLEKITFIKADINDQELLEKEFRDADYIIHLAAVPSIPRSLRQPVLTDYNNINGTVAVFEAARKLRKKVVFSSSSSVYGDSETLPKKESQALNPVSFYALQKYTCERYAELFHRLYGCDIIGVRFFNVFGPRQDPESEYAAVIPKFIHLIKQGETPTINGDGETTRDFTYVKNAVLGLLLACEAKSTKSRLFNIASGGRISLNELVRLINKNLGANVVPLHGPAKPGEVRHSQADISLAKEELGFEAKYSFEEGLRETIKSMDD